MVIGSSGVIPTRFLSISARRASETSGEMCLPFRATVLEGFPVALRLAFLSSFSCLAVCFAIRANLAVEVIECGIFCMVGYSSFKRAARIFDFSLALSLVLILGCCPVELDFLDFLVGLEIWTPGFTGLTK